ncbi:hypothetical protein NDU88_003874 [Pleurodeles waltl]|uniref:Uncharacterized protein n=1 Tax=Pleurodeles waltl TaxID=8319 RepID=A0AAV7RH21_PLEWA|nr:hypothetical protein NDU88_003874 [Pleurodeles waltl]
MLLRCSFILTLTARVVIPAYRKLHGQDTEEAAGEGGQKQDTMLQSLAIANINKTLEILAQATHLHADNLEVQISILQMIATSVVMMMAN